MTMSTLRGTDRLKGEEGAQTLEFALVAPLTIFLFFGIVYSLLAVAANVSLAHAASSAVRYASIPTDSIQPVYPSPAQVQSKLFAATPFFTQTSCTTSVTGASTPNSPVSLSVSCPFANPLGASLNGLRRFFGGSGDPFGSTFQMTATAKARRE